MKLSLPFSNKLKKILTYSREEAVRLCNDSIQPEHLMLGIIRDGDNQAYNILHGSLDIQHYKHILEDNVKNGDTAAAAPVEMTVSDETSDILRLSMLEAKLMKSGQIKTEHILLGFLKRGMMQTTEYLSNNGISYNKVVAALTKETTPKADISYDEEDEEDGPPANRNKGNYTTKTTEKSGNTDTPAIDSFGVDITAAAREGKLDPVVGREREIERIAQILSRRKKNNPVLIGEPGVGKSAIVEGLAMRIMDRKVSRVLFDKRIVSLDMSSIVAGTKYRGQFEERMRAIINELKAHPEIVVFIDEIHGIIGAGNQAGQMDAANMMKPALSRGELQCIGATTLDEYRKSIEKDGALERRFQKIIVEPTSTEETKIILRNIKDRYEAHHNVTYTEEAIDACVNLTERYVTDRYFPDKAIDALDEAGSRMHISNVSVPKEIEQQERLIDEAVKQKERLVKEQDYEGAADYRDREKALKAELAQMKADWEARYTETREIVDADQVPCHS